MTYYDRRFQLIKTLESIWYYGTPEIIVIDDASMDRIDDIKNINLIRIEPEQKWWNNPCIPYNMGFSKATGDIIIIQNPECIHIGDILKYTNKLTPGNLFSFAAYSLDYNLPVERYNYNSLKKLALNNPDQWPVGHRGWYNHSIYRPEALHFCNAICREDLQRIGGFDERYANGICFDDNDMVRRIKRAGINIQIIDDPFVIHQKHERTDYENKWPLRMNNFEIFNQTSGETIFKSPNNKYYGV